MGSGDFVEGVNQKLCYTRGSKEDEVCVKSQRKQSKGRDVR